MAPIKISRAAERQIDLTTAVCQERLLATHVRHVLALVDLVSEDLPFDNALDIYVRILGLTTEQARNIGSRALASLGSRGAVPEFDDSVFDLAAEEPAERAIEEPGGSRSDRLFSRLRRRIRGRVQDNLRTRIDLAAARAETALLEQHVRNSLTFVKALRDEEVEDPEAVELYLETMALPDGPADVIYNRALAVIARDALPPLPNEGAAGAGATREEEAAAELSRGHGA
ncbi:MAG: hypothetical protein ACREKN_08815 [Longimicrobiaceae bacterium]